MSLKNKQDELHCCEKSCIGTCCKPPKRARNSTDEASSVTMLDVLGVDVCRRGILGFLPLADLLRSEGVCQRWRDAMIHYIQGASRFRCRLHIVTPLHQSVLSPHCRALPLDEALPDSYARNLYKWGKSVEAAPCSADSFTAVVEHCPNLQELTLYGMPDQDLVKEYLGQLEKLKRLSFRDPRSQTRASEQVTDNNIGIFLENNTLEELTIAGVEQLTGACFGKLNENLTCLRLRDCPALDLHLLESALTHLRDLKTLELTGLSSKILQNIHVIIVKMDKLERLELRRYDEVVKPDLKVFECMKSLKHLNLSHNQAVNDCWLRAVAVGAKLESLDVSYCHGVSISDLENVCRACAWTMRELGVAGKNYINDEDIETLIRLCPNLSILNAQQCQGISQYLVFYLARLMRRRHRHRLPVLCLRLYGTNMPSCMIRKKFMRGQSLILDFTRDSRLPKTFEPDQMLTPHFPSGLMLSAVT